MNTRPPHGADAEGRGAAREGSKLRVLIVLPSWIGDVVMATPALRLIRDALPGSFVGGLARPGIDEILEGSDLLDETHVERVAGVMGPKHAAAKLRARRYDAALLLSNSFRTALIARLAFIPRRVGYDRDGRGILLTDRLQPPRTEAGRFAPAPAAEYYLAAARALVGGAGPARAPGLELGVSAAQRAAADELLVRAGCSDDRPIAIINPGANNAAKRWPAPRFAEIARRLVGGGGGGGMEGMRVLVSGSPAEASLAEEIVGLAGREGVVSLPALGVTIGSLKGVIARSRLMVTNDTGPRHIALALGVPTVTLFGPTDPRWTTPPPAPSPPPPPREETIVADPSLPPDLVADDHPERCRIDRIEVETVWRAVERALGAG